MSNNTEFETVAKITGIEIKDLHRHSFTRKVPEYVAAVKINTSAGLVTLEDMPVIDFDSWTARNKALTTLELAAAFLRKDLDYIQGQKEDVEKELTKEENPEQETKQPEETTAGMISPAPVNLKCVILTYAGGIHIDEFGNILKTSFHPSEDGSPYDNITKFHVDEWREFYGKTRLDAQIEMTDIGHWYFKEKNVLGYVKPIRKSAAGSKA